MNARNPLIGRTFLQTMPIAAMALVVMLLGVLLWVLQRTELEEERLTLIKDILWVEQNIHFHLTSAEEKLAQMATDLERGTLSPDGFAVSARALVANNKEIDRILLRDESGRAILAMPPAEGDPYGYPPDETAPWWTAFSLARSVGRAAWTGSFIAPGRGPVFEVHVPVYRHRQFAGTIVGIFATEGLLTHLVPWWVAEKYKVELVDAGGAVLGTKTGVDLFQPGPSHQVGLNPPGQGVAVVATVYRSATNLVRNILAAAIFTLAVVAAFSLWLLRRSVQRRQAAEQALLAEHAFRKAMEDSLTVGMRARDLDGRITYVNPAFCQMVGWSAAELVGTAPPMPYWLPEEFDQTMEMHRRVMAGDAPPDGFEIQFRRKNGEPFWALVYEAPLIGADGRQTGWMASVLDVTERKRAQEMARQQQEQLQRTARLITMGEMASTLAHELNQPLSAIASYTAGCLNRLDSPRFEREDLRPALAKVGQQAQRAGQIIRRVHDFVRKSEPRLNACALNQVIEDSVGFIEFDARQRGIPIQVALAGADPQVEADRILLEQVMLNLVRNGIEAMSHADHSGAPLVITVEAADDHAVVKVADHGPGIAADAADSLFQPFFTTKDEGMGMGLNICRSIIEFHRGRLWFEPNPSGGSVFCFSLPTRAA
ncbi:C4-dicarboxylate transport sensor protein DctS [Magnetospirillum sp. LM-5]|uniref:sensor histidine kinase n=1 Tax=Magnetospirillum sp. LM-5 TaxID=2681466 RepID=UPI001382620C|nr:PAS domain S-box protein [Magnetospirillum sp. LM-5]CAA7611497.1 C4-dicarboxylate transport sensor protein DctS [Magnetospirillum sp. LM-5]